MKFKYLIIRIDLPSGKEGGIQNLDEYSCPEKAYEEMNKLEAKKDKQDHFFDVVLRQDTSTHIPEVESESICLPFNFKHPKSGEERTIFLSEKEIQEKLESELYDMLTCDCEPIGETNVLECGCFDYIEQFDLLERP